MFYISIPFFTNCTKCSTPFCNWVFYSYKVNKMRLKEVKEFIQGETMQLEPKLKCFWLLGPRSSRDDTLLCLRHKEIKGKIPDLRKFTVVFMKIFWRPVELGRGSLGDFFFFFSCKTLPHPNGHNDFWVKVSGRSVHSDYPKS